MGEQAHDEYQELPPTNIDDLLKKKHEKVLMGTVGERLVKSNSAVSVTAPNKLEIGKARRELIDRHPLKCEEPENWNNIPLCVAESVSHVIQWILESDDSLFQFQTATNGRVYKLQDQMNKLKRECLATKTDCEKDLAFRAQQLETLIEEKSTELHDLNKKR